MTHANTKLTHTLQKLEPIAINIAKILGWVLVWSLLSVIWLGVFSYVILTLSATTTGILCFIALLPILFIYQYYAALHNLIALPQRLRDARQDSIDITPTSIQKARFNGFSILKYIWILKSSLDEAQEFIIDYVDLSLLVNPAMLTLLAMALFSCLALWLNVILTVLISFFIV